MPKIKKTKKQLREEMADSLVIESLPKYFFIACVIATFAAMFYILWPLLSSIFIAAVLAIAFNPVNKKFVKWFKDRRRVASVLTCFIVFLVIVIPLAVLIAMLSSEVLDTYGIVNAKLESGVFDKYLLWEKGGFFYDMFEWFKVQLSPIVDIQSFEIKDTILSVVQVVSKFLGDELSSFLNNIISFVIGLVVMFFSLYYFFKDGNELVDHLGYISPIPEKYESELFKKTASMVKAIIFGVFFTAVLQGFIGGIGFAIVGISSPVFWGTVMGFLSLLPVVGTAIVWVPAAIVLVVLGQYYSALFLFLWGMLLVGSIDNFARTYLIGGKARTYPLLTFFVILGGVWMLDLKGVIVGPLVLIILMSFLHIYESEYSQVLKKQSLKK
ncbi:AI-2E family transporter [Candidatus Peregrinibacteria bacterium]|nr:AI-2E family transporter [Candidatus Peregrinibacteria bacterium]